MRKPSSLCRMMAVSLVAALLILAGTASAGVIYVRAGATGLNNGADWTNAFSSLHTGLAQAVSGDTVYVAQGLYLPGAPGQTSATFTIPSGVSVKGSFAGVGQFPNMRSLSSTPTVMSGDIGQDDSWGNPWWYGMNIGTANSLHVATINGNGGPVLLDGLRMTSGGPIQSSGGAVYAQHCDLVMKNCIVERCVGYQGYGCGVLLAGGSLTMESCKIRQNWGRFVNGTGVYVGGTATTTIVNCDFQDNRGESDTSLGNGAGMHLDGSLPSSVTGSRFTDNQTFPFFSSSPNFGGGIHNTGSALTVDRCSFERNQSVNGGGIYSWRDLTVTNSLFRSNSVIAAPSGGGFGGGIGVYYYADYLLKVSGCTFVKNNAHETAGVYYAGYSTYRTDISNSVFWGNTDINGTVSQTSVKKASNSCVENLWITIPGEDPIDPEKFPNCFDSNPQFVSYPANVRLKLTSPCVDSADKSKFGTGPWFDQDNLLRFVDVPSVPDTGIGTAPLPDMGCYEASAGRHLGFVIGM